MNTTTMTGIAREAMRRAQAGDWALADAIELRARQHNTDFDNLLYGIPQGGRLQFLAWGTLAAGEDAGEIRDEDLCWDWDFDTITAFTTLNGDVVWHRDSGADIPDHLIGSELTLWWAEGVIDEYRKELAQCEQTPLDIPEAA